ncbi:Amino acid adenylation domain-containing protein OS=Streptomyces alboniger OX=132473 GN=CP975_32015 PE=4 SV=1 [Streptomyces alboniger]
MGEWFERALEEMAADPTAPLGRLDVLGGPELSRVVEGWNDTARPVVAGSVVEAFEGWVARSPDAVAVLSGPEQGRAYVQLDERANRLARYLVGLGVGVESRVGSVSAAWGWTWWWRSWRCGRRGRRRPLDPEYPVDRLAFMVADSGVEVVLTGDDPIPVAGARVVRVDDPVVAEQSPEPVRGCVGADQLAYVIYTSGRRVARRVWRWRMAGW